MSEAGAMAGGGYYGAHSAPQEAYGELGVEWLQDAARAAPPPPAGAPHVLADLGAAGGRNSLAPLRRAIAALREGRPPGPVLVVHTDIPANDFSALFEEVEGATDSYLAAGDVYALAAGRSFYERLFPRGLLSLAWCSIAVHWLSALPEPVPGHIYCSSARGAVRDALREQSRRDWEAFLAHRAVELRAGGGLVVVGGAALDDGSSGAEGLMAMAEGALARLVDAGLLRPEERERMTIPTWNRTEQEFLAPFGGGDGAGPGGLGLRRHAMRSLPDPYYGAYRADGDVAAYAAAVAGFFRAAFEPSLWASLDDDRDGTARAAIAARFVAELRAAIAAAPADAACTWHVAVLDLAASV